MIHVRAEKSKKLDGRSEKCVFVGYCLTEKQYKVCNPVTRRMSFTRDVVFREGEKWAKGSSPTTDTTGTFGGEKIRPGSLKLSHIFEQFISKEEDIAVEELSMDGPAPRELQELPDSAEGDSSGSSVFFRQEESEVLPSHKKPSTWGKIGRTERQALLETEGYQAPDLNCRRQTRSAQPGSPHGFLTQVIYEPKRYQQALRSEESSEWLRSMQCEINSINSRSLGSIVKIPEGRKAIGRKWGY